MSDDLQYRLRDRSQRLWATGQDLLDNLLFREAFDCILGLERDYIEACNEAADCYVKQCVAENKLIKAVAALHNRMHCHDCSCGECDHIRTVLAELEMK